MKNNGKYIVGLIILILVLVFGAGIIIVNRSSTARRIQVVYIPKARDDANDFWTSLLKGAQMAANEYDVDLTILAPDSEQDFEAQVRYIDEAIAMNPNAIILSPSSKSELTEAANRIFRKMCQDKFPHFPSGSHIVRLYHDRLKILIQFRINEHQPDPRDNDAVRRLRDLTFTGRRKEDRIRIHGDGFINVAHLSFKILLGIRRQDRQIHIILVCGHLGSF